jgi:hypothetical protein
MARTKQSTPETGSNTRWEALRDQPREVLVALLEELAARYPEVEARLDRLALGHAPATLAADFRKRLQSWKRSRRFLGRSAAGGFGRELEDWLDEVQRELLPLDPLAAHKLADSFLRADKYFFEQADDSDGAIGDAIRAGCRLWLHSAKAQPAKRADHWDERIYALVSADEYGAREELLRASDTLFDETGLRALAGRFDADLTKALAAKRETGRADHAMYKAAAAIGLIADALRDPDLSTQTTLRYSPDPNPLQKEQFAERYVRFGRAKDALPWLEGDWGYAEDRRLRLQAEAYVALGDQDRLCAIRQALFERTGTADDFEAWHQALSPAERPGAVERAFERARTHEDPITGANLYLALSDEAAAEQLLVDRHGDLRGDDYYRLVPLAQLLESKGRLLGAVACYRALLVAILTRGYARAYGHAADYLHVLRSLDARVGNYRDLATHQAFESTLRSAHGRKVSFWNRVQSR